MLNRHQLEVEIYEYIEREYCEGGGAIEILISRLTVKQLEQLHYDLVEWFGTLEEIRPEGESK